MNCYAFIVMLVTLGFCAARFLLSMPKRRPNTGNVGTRTATSNASKADGTFRNTLKPTLSHTICTILGPSRTVPVHPCPSRWKTFRFLHALKNAFSDDANALQGRGLRQPDAEHAWHSEGATRMAASSPPRAMQPSLRRGAARWATTATSRATKTSIAACI